MTLMQWRPKLGSRWNNGEALRATTVFQTKCQLSHMTSEALHLCSSILLLVELVAKNDKVHSQASHRIFFYNWFN